MKYTPYRLYLIKDKTIHNRKNETQFMNRIKKQSVKNEIFVTIGKANDRYVFSRDFNF